MSELAESSLLRLIPALPLASALILGLLLGIFRRVLPRLVVISLSCGSIALAFLVTCAAFAELVSLSGEPRALLDPLGSWIAVGSGDAAFRADAALVFDPLSAVMCLVVTGVGFLIHVYAVGYMDEDVRGDGGYQRFFCYLNLFVFSMLLLILAENMLLMFVGWEGVGLCSYLLIGFWYGERENAYAGAKAFIVNRIGDVGLLVGMLLTFWALAQAGEPTLSFRGIEAHFGAIADIRFELPAFLGGLLGEKVRLVTLIGVCFFVAACGKSAQLPLSVWLPDAMAGPTPVSALIHAATMVTAGVYLVCRLSFLYAALPATSALICWVGGATALWGAGIACVQTDIKRVLAYSTVSQLGYMFLAVGAGAFSVAIFHVVTHAFFKALLFMGAGAVILALHHEQDLRKMGGLRARLPRTYWAMLVGVAAIGGVPMLSGFFSKDAILLSLYVAEDVPGHLVLYGVGVVTAGITAFYAARLFCLVFLGPGRSGPARLAEARDPVSWILWPLYGLAALAFLGGLFGLPAFWGERLFGVESSDSVGNILAGVVAAPPPHEIRTSEEWRHVGITVMASTLGFAAAYALYIRRPQKAAELAQPQGWLYRLLRNSYYLDEIYDRTIVRPLVWLSERVLYRGVDVGLIDGVAVNGSAMTVRALASHGLKYAQSGLTQGYFFVMVLGALAFVGYLIR